MARLVYAVIPARVTICTDSTDGCEGPAVAASAETGKPSKRDEVLALLRDEWRRGFANDVVPGGMRALLAEYAPFIPPEVVGALKNYSTLDPPARKQALTLARPLLSAPPAPLTAAPPLSRPPVLTSPP